MKKTILLSYLALFIVLGFPLLLRGRALPEPETPAPSAAEPPVPETSSAPAPLAASGLADQSNKPHIIIAVHFYSYLFSSCARQAIIGKNASHGKLSMSMTMAM